MRVGDLLFLVLQAFVARVCFDMIGPIHQFVLEAVVRSSSGTIEKPGRRYCLLVMVMFRYEPHVLPRSLPGVRQVQNMFVAKTLESTNVAPRLYQRHS